MRSWNSEDPAGPRPVLAWAASDCKSFRSKVSALIMPRNLFAAVKVFIGVVHLPPLPGSPRWCGDMEQVLDQAGEEAAILDRGGADGIIVENFGDAPFRIGRVEPETVAAMTLAAQRVRQTTQLPVGINMLRNDAQSALAVAAVTGAAFIRVNVHYGVMAADEGMVQGQAFQTLRQRRALGVDIKILADVMVKHAVPIGLVDLGLVAKETVQRGLADGLIVSGPVTGQPASASDVAAARKAVPSAAATPAGRFCASCFAGDWSAPSHLLSALTGPS